MNKTMAEQLKELEPKLQVFTCGRPRDHECDDKGPSIVFNSERSMLESEAKKLADWPKGWSGGSVTCSVCGTSSYENSFWQD